MTLLGQGRVKIGFYEYFHVTADTLIKNGAGRFHTITINSCGVAGTLTIYDNTIEAGTVISAIVIPVNPTPFTLHYDLEFDTGLYLGYDVTLIADITVSYW